MKKFSLFFIVLLFLISTSVTSFGKDTIGIIINNQCVTFSNKTGYPFIDENGRTQVPFRVTLEAFGAEVKWDSERKMAYAIYNNKTVYAPIGESYIIVNGVEEANDTAAILKNSITYCPIRKVLEAFGFDVSWDGSTNSVIVKTNDSLDQVPHPPVIPLYTATEGDGKYAGYKILHGHTLENEYIIYFTYEKNDSNSSMSVKHDSVSDINYNEKISWNYNGQTYVNTRGELYSFFSDTVSLSSYLNNTDEVISHQWLESTFGQVYDEWLYSISIADYALRCVEDYIDGVVKPAPLDFTIIQDDWISSQGLKEHYNLNLISYATLNGLRLEWRDPNITDKMYIYELTGYQDFSYGLLEFNKIRVITDKNSNVFFYKPDIEEYVMSRIQQETPDVVEFNSKWATSSELVSKYGIKFEYNAPYAYFMDVKNHECLIRFDNYDPEFTGEITLGEFTMTKDENNEIMFLTEGLDENIDNLQTQKEEFDNKWISYDEYQEYELLLYPDIDDEDFSDYIIKGNGIKVVLEDFKEFFYDGETGTTKNFEGIKVYLTEKEMRGSDNTRAHFNKADLIKKGLISE